MGREIIFEITGKALYNESRGISGVTPEQLMKYRKIIRMEV